MTDEDAAPSRRKWREKHKPVVRRQGAVFALAEIAVPALAVGMFAVSGGGRFGDPLPPDDSAWWIVCCSALMAVALVITVTQLFVERHHAPLSVSGTVVVAAIGGLSMLVVLARNGGVVSTPIVVMFFSNLACLAVGCIAVAVAARRRPLAEDAD